MTRPFLPFPVLATLLLLPLLAPLGGAEAPAADCLQPTPGEQVCYDVTQGACVWSTQFGTATDFGTIQKACATLYLEHFGPTACVELVAGLGTYGGFVGPYGVACAASWSSRNGDLCADAWGSQNGVAWSLPRPVCINRA